MSIQADSLKTNFSNLAASTELLAAKMAEESGLAWAAKEAAKGMTALFNSLAGVPRSVKDVEADIDRLTKTLQGAGTRSKWRISGQISDLREELKQSLSISSDQKEISRAIKLIDADIEQYRATLSKFADAEPSKRVRTGRGSKENPEYKRYIEATELIGAAAKDRAALLKQIGDAANDADKGSRAIFKVDSGYLKQFSETRTEAEAYTIQIATLQTQLAQGAISQEIFNRSVADAADAYTATLDSISSFDSSAGQSVYSERLNALDQYLMSDLERQKAHTDELKTEVWQAYYEGAIQDRSAAEDRIFAIDEMAAQRKKDLDRREQQEKLKNSADFFGNLATVSAVFGKKSAKATKSLAIAQATINTYASATAAFSSFAGLGPVGVALGTAAAAAAIATGLQNVAMIKNTNYAGAYDKGGYIPAGKTGVTGEYGMEMVNGPANVTSREDTLGLLKQAANNSGGNNVAVNITVRGTDTNNAGRTWRQIKPLIEGEVRRMFHENNRRFA
jgi:hypothetical protein